VKPAQLLFAHHRLVERERALRDDIERVESRLASDPEVVELEEALAQALAAQEVMASKLRDSDREREAHRTTLHLMEDADSADEAVRGATLKLAEARKKSASEEPDLKEELAAWRAELAEVEGERDEVWSQVPPAAQAAYTRMRMHPPVAAVVGNQCQACRVTVTSSGMQVLRKGSDDIVHCENCGRILVLS